VFAVITIRNPCFSNADCPGYDPNTHLKLYCDPITHTCKPIPFCTEPVDCADGWCCYSWDIEGDGSCKPKGTIVSYEGKSWLCDPPEGFISLTKENTIKSAKKLSLFDLLINLFYLLIR